MPTYVRGMYLLGPVQILSIAPFVSCLLAASNFFCFPTEQNDLHNISKWFITQHMPAAIFEEDVYRYIYISIRRQTTYYGPVGGELSVQNSKIREVSFLHFLHFFCIFF